jgi:2-keto-4-pentenoate hydratase/2-oxohepta-3-ene-1,7-dioic acid hydratase in catechol pathway
MQLLRYLDGDEPRYGRLDGETVRPLDGDLFGDYRLDGPARKLADCRLLAPCAPTKVIGVGKNFKQGFQSEADWFKHPGLFLKLPTSVVGPTDPIVLPRIVTGVLYEAELALVIGKRAVDVTEAEALDYVFGYTCMNDVSTREYAMDDVEDFGPGGALVKACDAFAPMGPVIRTDLDPSNARIRAWLNGELKQDATTADLVHNVAQIVSFASGVFTLLPGDVITTGTPPGIEVIHAGDVIECEVEGIGRIRNQVVARPVSH